MKARSLGLGALVGGAAVIGGQVVYASLRDLPVAEGFDPSGTFGGETSPPLRIALLGDSVITGQGLRSVDDSWPRLVARRLSGRYRVVLRNYAVGGARSADVLHQQLPRLLVERFDVAIVSAGGNDILHATPPWLTEQHLDETVARLQDVCPSVVLFGVGDLGSIPRVPFPADRVAAMSGHVADWIQCRVAERRGIEKVDQWALTTDAFNSGPHMFAPDLFHASAEGHIAWADALMPTIESELDRIGLGVVG